MKLSDPGAGVLRGEGVPGVPVKWGSALRLRSRIRRSGFFMLLSLILPLSGSGCGSSQSKGSPPIAGREQKSSVPGAIRDPFTDIAAESGVNFTHFNDASRHRYLPETMGSGAVAGSRTWTRMLVSGRSYLSACEPILTMGVGKTSRLDRLDITRPSGITQTVENPPLNRMLTVEEPVTGQYAAGNRR